VPQEKPTTCGNDAAFPKWDDRPAPDSNFLGNAADATAVTSDAVKKFGEVNAKATPADARLMGKMGTAGGWVARIFSAFDFINATPEERPYKAVDFAATEVASDFWGLLGTAGGVVWTQAGGSEMAGRANSGYGRAAALAGCLVSQPKK
jgi:hypothetical protein